MPSPPANASAPGDEPPPGRWAAVSPPSGSGLAHLLPCPACGALNGRSALACWDCESSLLTDQHPWSSAAADRAASRPAALSPHKAEHAPTGTAARTDDDIRQPHEREPASDTPPLASAPLPMPLPLRPSVDAHESRLDLPVLTMAVAPPRPRPRRRLLVAAGVVAALAGVLAAVVALEFRRDATEVATREPPAAAAPAPAAATPPVPAVAAMPSRATPVTLDFDSLPAPATGPATPAPPRAAALAAPKPDTPPAARPTSRAPVTARAAAPVAAPPPAPARATVYPSPASPPPAAVVGPCTANVAALGLCSPAAP